MWASGVDLTAPGPPHGAREPALAREQRLRAEQRPAVRGVALHAQPREPVIADHLEVEAGLLGGHGVGPELARPRCSHSREQPKATGRRRFTRRPRG
jgi:hypothetical protein